MHYHTTRFEDYEPHIGGPVVERILAKAKRLSGFHEKGSTHSLVRYLLTAAMGTTTAARCRAKSEWSIRAPFTMG